MASVAIIGGGFAGVRAARSLRSARCDVTLFDGQSESAMLPALPDLAGGWLAPALVATEIAPLLPPNVTHRRTFVERIVPASGEVVAEGRSEKFDYILLASGSRALPHPFQEGAGVVHSLDSLDAAIKLRDAWLQYLKNSASPQLVVVGGGYTGLELATSLAARARAERGACQVKVVEANAELLPFITGRQRDRVRHCLRALGIELHLGVRVANFEGGSVTIGGEQLDNVFFCWSAGSIFAGPELPGNLPRLRDGRIIVRSDLSVEGAPRLFVAGDAAAFMRGDAPLRKAVNAAWYQGAHAGRNIARALRGRRPLRFRPFDPGWVIPLHLTAVGRMMGGFALDGGIGLRVHYLMCGLRSQRLSQFFDFTKVSIKLFGDKTR